MSALDHPQVESSLEGFLERVRPRLKSLFARYRIPPQDTEDLLQQALMALIYHRDGVRDPEAWLMGTLRNKCLLYWREQRRKLYDTVDSAVLDILAEPIAPAQEGADRHRDLTQALERLPERCRSLLWLRYRQGYDPPELAERLGYSPASISKVTTRCLAALARQMVTVTAGVCRRKAK
jgi:RNA polymerase sigma-70 factor (ECF subfamily)